MLPQNGQLRQQQQQQQPGLSMFTPSSSAFDAPQYFNMDSTQAAKQMAALTAASQARIANTRPTPLFNPQGGTNSASFLGGINPPNYSGASNYDLSPAWPTAQMLPGHNMPPASNPASFLDGSMSHQGSGPRPANNAALKQRQQGFLNGLANVMAQRGTPLPPTLTGVSTPNYDPNASLWKSLEVSSEVGHFRLAGKDINLFKLWGSVFQNGGGHAVSSNNGWGGILAQFNLPEEVAQEPPNVGTTSVAQTIAQYYMALLYPFEQYYKSNIQEQQKRALATSRQPSAQGPQPPTTPNRPVQAVPGGAHPAQMVRGGTNNLQSPMNSASGATLNGGSHMQPPHHTPLQQSAPMMTSQFTNTGASYNAEGLLDELKTNGSDANVLDQEMQGIKRKIEDEDRDGKRTRQKIGSDSVETLPSIDSTNDRNSSVANSTGLATTTTSTGAAPPRPRQQPSRRKIEYVPLAREVDTYGGRDLKLVEHELGTLSQRRPIREINDWGTVEIEALTMSLRSRLSIELSYALTTFTLLSTMRGQTPGSGFPIFQCPDLLDEMLDLLEDIAFGTTEDATEIDPPIDLLYITTNRELVHVVHESQSLPFSVLQPNQGSKDPALGPCQRPGGIILAIVNIIRNLSTVPDNVEFISRHTRLVDLMFRICSIKQDVNCTPSPASAALSLTDLIALRKDVLYTLTTIAGNFRLSTSHPKVTLRMASRAFQLVSSYLVDPTEAVSPFASVQLAGVPPSGNIKPPSLADVALDVFSRLGQTDTNRQIFAKSIPQEALLRLLEALVHRLPVVDADFQLMTRDIWLSYLEKIILAIYSLAFLAPPAVKEKVKANRTLGFKSVMFRLIQKFLMTPNPDGRGWFIVCTRRAIETMKVLDDAEDSFDTSQSIAPTMSFGMGFGEVGDKESEPGTGLLGGHRNATWDMLMLRDVYGDEVMFGELESLARVEC